MPITIESSTAQAAVEVLKQQLPPAEWEKLPRLIEQANQMVQANGMSDEEDDFYAVSRQATARFFEDEEV
ncbi:hypothetical protein IAD21_04447 [Abditibacteriota bacterium]|nr:hypothetical protein IAD21_04447 [Abditibacteriota bacterium]